MPSLNPIDVQKRRNILTAASIVQITGIIVYENNL
jgi:hypothetical protein